MNTRLFVSTAFRVLFTDHFTAFMVVLAFAGVLAASLSSRNHDSGRSGPDAIVAVLTDFHDAASKADGPRYFNHMTPDAVFIGTDATERWTKPEFQAYAKPYFDKGKGWTYTAVAGRRFVTIAPDGNTAWFDEALMNEKYGECRGSGVLQREAGEWKIAQYNLSVPVPNDMMEDVTKRIKAATKR